MWALVATAFLHCHGRYGFSTVERQPFSLRSRSPAATSSFGVKLPLAGAAPGRLVHAEGITRSCAHPCSSCAAVTLPSSCYPHLALARCHPQHKHQSPAAGTHPPSPQHKVARASAQRRLATVTVYFEKGGALRGRQGCVALNAMWTLGATRPDVAMQLSYASWRADLRQSNRTSD